MKPLRINLRLGLGEEFVVVLPENRALRGDGFEALTMQMVCEFMGELVEAVEIGVEMSDSDLLSQQISLPVYAHNNEGPDAASSE